MRDGCLPSRSRSRRCHGGRDAAGALDHRFAPRGRSRTTSGSSGRDGVGIENHEVGGRQGPRDQARPVKPQYRRGDEDSIVRLLDVSACLSRNTQWLSR